MSSKMKYAIGIDMGGTKIEGSIVNQKGKILKTIRRPTETHKSKGTIIGNIVGVISDLHKTKTGKIKGVGLSLPGFVNEQGRIIFGGGTLTKFVGVNLKKELKKKTGLPVFLENDANCFALAESVYGAGKKHDVVLGVIWGTGVGGGIVVKNKLFRGSFGGAGEFGHILIDPSITTGPKCGCGQRGCLEMLSSGKNIMRKYQVKGGKIPNANPRQIYYSKEKVAKEVISDAINYLGIGIAILVTILNPDIIVLGGGVSKLPNAAYKRLRRDVTFHCSPVFTKNLKIVRHKISDSVGILGAAELVFHDLR